MNSSSDLINQVLTKMLIACKIQTISIFSCEWISSSILPPHKPHKPYSLINLITSPYKLSVPKVSPSDNLPDNKPFLNHATR